MSTVAGLPTPMVRVGAQTIAPVLAEAVSDRTCTGQEWLAERARVGPSG